MRGKRVLLGITGGIAAYKIAFLIRLLKKSGAEVKCIMTPASCDFISPLVVSTLSDHPVGIEFWDKSNGTWANHVEYGIWADVFLIAPCTANTLAKMSIGSADNLLLATYLSMKSKTIVAPAMDLDMYAHPTLKRNLEQLKLDGVAIIPAESGELASGLEGEGRMAEPETLFTALENFFKDSLRSDFHDCKVLVTAGPTHEALDPVRFLGNHSSGKMGFAIAKEFASRGAEVILITGPVNLEVEYNNIERIDVVSAEQMMEQVQKYWLNCDVGVFAAAVADYRPQFKAEQKIKKADSLTLSLVRNPDTLAWAGENKNENQKLVGFALETENLIENGSLKLQRKNLDGVVINSTSTDHDVFGSDMNKIYFLDANNNLSEFELKSKELVAKDVVNCIKLLR